MAKRLARAAGMAALMGVAGATGVAGEARADREWTIVVHLEDYVRLPPKDLRAMRKEVDKIFRASGVTVSWAGPLRTPVIDASPDGLCHVAVALVNVPQADGAARDKADVLGRAAPSHGRAWVYSNRVMDSARDQPVDANLALARVVAHEIGHLLLPPRPHAASGIMRPGIELTQLGFYRFTPDESEMIRVAIAVNRDCRTKDRSPLQPE